MSGPRVLRQERCGGHPLGFDVGGGHFARIKFASGRLGAALTGGGVLPFWEMRRRQTVARACLQVAFGAF